MMKFVFKLMISGAMTAALGIFIMIMITGLSGCGRHTTTVAQSRSVYPPTDSGIYVDLWLTETDDTAYSRGAVGINGSSPVSSDESRIPFGVNGSVVVRCCF